MILYALEGSDAPGNIRYVGVTRNPEQRLAFHRSGATPVGEWARSLRAAGHDVRMIVLAVTDNAGVRFLEEETITRHQINGRCDLNAPRLLRKVQTGEIVVQGRRAKVFQRHIAAYLEAA